MTNQFIKIIVRNWKSKKSSFVINLLGLTTGMTCAILIFLWISDEFSFDKFHEKESQLFQIMTSFHVSGSTDVTEATSGVLAETLLNEFPEIEYAETVYEPSNSSILSVKDNSFRALGLYSGENFFNMFSYDLIQGNREDIMLVENSIVISNSLAQKLFNTTIDVLGNVVELNNDKQLIISGVFDDVPANSSIQFEFVLPYSMMIRENPDIHAWGQNYFKTFLIIKDGSNIPDLNHKISQLFREKTNSATSELFVRPYAHQHLYNTYENGVLSGGRITVVRLFSVIAVLILTIACINFMNLSTAAASKRLKEIWLKKAIGAGYRSLIVEFLCEAFMFSFMALIVSVLLVSNLLPYFNEFIGKSVQLFPNLNLILFLLFVTFITTLLSGLYPAIYFSGAKHADIFRNKFKFSSGESGIRRGLVIFQYAVSIILIISIIGIHRQMEYIAGRDQGYRKENVIYFENEGEVRNKMQAFISELKEIPGVLNASSTAWNFISSRASAGGVDWEGKQPDDNVIFEVQQVNFDLIETLGIEVKEGRSFNENYMTDNTAIIFNEAAIDVMGLDEPVGKTVNVWGAERQIVGVVKDFHFESIHEKINPLFFILYPANSRIIMVRIAGDLEHEVTANIGNLYSQFNPKYPFEYHYLDQDFHNQYITEKRTAGLTGFFSGIVILISSLGLFGLALYSAERRTKEIGIRKVNGAKIWEVMAMLNMDFVKWVVIAFMVAAPVAWYAMNRWLQNFAYRTDLSWWIFALAGVIALGIALLTVSWQSWHAARRNPVEALRYE